MKIFSSKYVLRPVIFACEADLEKNDLIDMNDPNDPNDQMTLNDPNDPK